MTFPKIDADDLVLFGSLALSAIGVALVVATTTGDAAAAVGTAFLMFGIVATLITFMASGESE